MQSRGFIASLLLLWCFVYVSQAPASDNRLPNRMKAIVVDANGTSLAGASIYREVIFTWDSGKGLLCLAKEANLVAQTDANGEFVFDLPSLGHGVVFAVVDESLKRFGYLRVHRKEQKRIHTITLTEPAYVKVLLESEGTPFTNISINIGFSEPSSGSVLPLITAAYDFNEPVDLFPINIACPSGCHLYFRSEIPYAGKIGKFRKDVPPLAPTEVFHLGRIRTGSRRHTLVGKEAPSLQVAEWLKGERTSLETLKGKIVLLDFWGLWCGPCRRMFPKLTRLHNRYSRDGLLIIAIHDSSVDKETFLKQSQKVFNLSDIPFRMALDSLVDEVSSGDKVGSAGKGRTIETYGVSRFPTLVLIKQDGKIDWEGIEKVEERINLLLYGHTKNLSEPSKLLYKKELFLITIASGGLLLVGLYCTLRLRLSRIAEKRRKQG